MIAPACSPDRHVRRHRACEVGSTETMEHVLILRKSRAPVLVACFLLSASAAGAQTLQVEENEWNQALAQGTAAAFERYLVNYPAGRFASDAFRCSVEIRIDPGSGGCSASPARASRAGDPSRNLG